LCQWIDLAAKRLRPKGYLTLIQRVERLPDILLGFQGRLGSISVQPLAPRDGRAPHLVLVRARKSGRAAFQLLGTKSLHLGLAHAQDRPDYAPEISAILRDGAEFFWHS
jgi:tRNA1(Val) A37 N6-methylase TrmN6